MMESPVLILASGEQRQDLGAAALRLRAMVLQAVASASPKRNCAKAVFTLCANRFQGISRIPLMEYRASMSDRELSPSTINVRLSAIRKLIGEAQRNGILDREQATQMADAPNFLEQGTRMGN